MHTQQWHKTDDVIRLTLNILYTIPGKQPPTDKCQRDTHSHVRVTADINISTNHAAQWAVYTSGHQ